MLGIEGNMGGQMPKVFVHSPALITPAGSQVGENCDSWRRGLPVFSPSSSGLAGRLSQKTLQAMTRALPKGRQFERLDPVSKLGLWAAQQSLQVHHQCDFEGYAVLFASSRGATESLETAVVDWSQGKRLAATVSPLTTANSSAATIAKTNGLRGLHLSLSAACSSSLHAVGLGFALIRAGVVPGVLAVGSEWANTEFFEHALAATGITTKSCHERFPQRPFHRQRDGMVLSQGAAALLVSPAPQPGCAEVLGYAGATDHAGLTGITEAASGLQDAIHQALAQAELSPEGIDLVVTHGAATIKGDLAEKAALDSVFVNKLPAVTANKWLFGHMLGAAGIASTVMAMEHLSGRCDPELPYPSLLGDYPPFDSRKASTALVLSLGFGGNAAALIIRRYIEPEH